MYSYLVKNCLRKIWKHSKTHADVSMHATRIAHNFAWTYVKVGKNSALIADKRLWWVVGVRVGSTPCWRRRRMSGCISWSSWSWGAPGSPSGLPSSSHSGSSPSHSPPHTSSLHTSATGHTTKERWREVCFCTTLTPLPSIIFSFSQESSNISQTFLCFHTTQKHKFHYFLGICHNF